MAVIDYKELIAWQRSMDLVEAVYVLSSCFPPDERFGLTNQVRRAAVSVASNVAEGQGRGARNDFLHFLRVANGSRQEVETQVLLAIRLGFTSEAEAQAVLELVAESGRLISGLYRSIEDMLDV